MNYWSFSGNYNDQIGSATLSGGLNYALTTDRFGNANSALNLNTGYMNIPSGIFFNGSFTIIGWINPTAINQSYSRFIEFGNGNPNDNVQIAFSNGTLNFPNVNVFNATVSKNNLVSNSYLNISTWYHIAFTQDSLGNSNLYLNGIVSATSKVQFTPNSVVRNNNYIGRSSWPYSYANAIVDDIKIYNGALSASSVYNDYVLYSPTVITDTATSTFWLKNYCQYSTCN